MTQPTTLAIEYFRARGIDKSTADLHGISVLSPDETANITRGKHYPSIRIPYINLDGEEVGYRLRYLGANLPVDKDGKPQKYDQPLGQANRLYIPRNTRPFLSDPTTPLIITEGEMKALRASQEFIPVIALSGVWQWRGRERPGDKSSKSSPIPDLDLITWQGRKVFICFDSDQAENAGVSNAQKALAVHLTNRGAEVSIILLPDNNGAKLGLDDYLQLHGAAAFNSLKEQAQPFQEWRRAQKKEKPTDPRSSNRSKPLEQIRDLFAHRLRFNIMSKEVELDGNPLSLDLFYCELLDEFGIDVGKDKAIDWVSYLARKNQYHPVAEYLKGVHRQHGASNLGIIENLSKRYLGTTNPLFDIYLKRTLIAAVARALQPGCKVDTVLVLQGAQGMGKSTFFRVLTGEAWFDDNVTYSSDKDEKMKLTRFWMLEWAELEGIFKRRDIAQVRAFITSSTDSLRVPYGRSIEVFPRHSILVATCNPDEVLNDPEGNRRYWMLPVQSKRIDIQSLAAERDQIWAAAVELYHRGEQWWLTLEEQQKSSEMNMVFESEHPWQPLVERWIAANSPDRILITDLLQACLGLEAWQIDRSKSMQAAEILKRLGWEKSRNKTNRFWRKPENPEKGSHRSHPEPEIQIQQEIQPVTTLVTTSSESNKGSHPTPSEGDYHPPVTTPGDYLANGGSHPSNPDTASVLAPGDYHDYLLQGKKSSEKKNTKNHQVFSPGDKVKYCGPPGAMAVTCQGKILSVLVVADDVCLVDWDKWVTPHRIPSSHLRKA